MLTLSQRRTYDFILKYFQAHDMSPTAAEIAQGIGIKSRGVVHRYLQALAQAGVIALTPNRHRNIRLLTEMCARSPGLPLVGKIAAGSPIAAIQQDESIDIATVLLGPNRYALRVSGDSMIEEGIHDGDIIVCEQRDTAQEGDIVVALIDREEATLKRLHYLPDDQIALIPANAVLTPMIFSASRVTIQGVFVGLLRLPSSSRS